MTNDVFARIKKVFHRRRRLAVAIAFFLIIVYVPFVPYSPECSQYSGKTVGSIFLAKNFQDIFVGGLGFWEVAHLSVGNVVLLRFWTWFADPGDWVLNSSNKSVRHFIEKGYGANLETVPPHVRQLVETYRGSDGRIDLECPLVRAVAIEGW